MKQFPYILSCRSMIRKDQLLGPLPPDGEVYHRAFSLAWPTVVESVLVSLVSALDSMMVGVLGPEAIAAVGITTQSRFLFLAVIIALNVGVTAVVARRAGEGDMEGAQKCLRQAVTLSAGLSVVLAAAAIVLARPLLTLAGAQPDVINDSVAYFRIVNAGLFFTAVSLTINAAQRGVGNTRISMVANVSANGVNLIFNYLLIGGNLGFPRLGVAGAAIATDIGFVVGFLLALRSVIGHHSLLRISFKGGLSFDRRTLAGIWKVGSGSLAEQVFLRIGFFAYAAVVAQLGTLVLAAHQICLNIINLSFAVGDGFGSAATALTGQSLGQQRSDLAVVNTRVIQRMAFGSSVLIFFVFVLGRTQLAELFTRDKSVIAMTAIPIIIMAVVTFFQTSALVLSGCLRGAGDSAFVAFSSVVSVTLVRPILGYIFCYPLGGGLVGAWLALLVDQFLRFAFSFGRFLSGKWKTIRL